MRVVHKLGLSAVVGGSEISKLVLDGLDLLLEVLLTVVRERERRELEQGRRTRSENERTDRSS